MHVELRVDLSAVIPNGAKRSEESPSGVGAFLAAGLGQMPPHREILRLRLRMTDSTTSANEGQYFSRQDASENSQDER